MKSAYFLSIFFLKVTKTFAEYYNLLQRLTVMSVKASYHNYS